MVFCISVFRRVWGGSFWGSLRRSGAAAPACSQIWSQRQDKPSHHCPGNGLALTSRRCNGKMLCAGWRENLSVPEFLTVGTDCGGIAAA